MKYIHTYKDRNGKERTYFRRPGAQRIALEGEVGSDTFRAAYAQAVKLPVTPVVRGEKKLAPLPRPDSPDASVYFVRGGDFVKIGTALNVTKRLGELKVGSPFKLTLLLTVPGGGSVEKAFHRRFADLRVRGEWFKAEPALTDFIQLERTNARRKNGYSKKTVG